MSILNDKHKAAEDAWTNRVVVDLGDPDQSGSL